MELPDTFKKYFPFFGHNPHIIYLDSAATTLKPSSVIKSEQEYLERLSSNVGRGLYPLAETTTSVFEDARSTIAHFIGAKNEEIIFTAGTTDSINMAARLIEPLLSEKHTIITTELEHHSNFLPWKELARRTEARCIISPITSEGMIDTEALAHLAAACPAIIAFTAVSNVTGAINPVADIIKCVRTRCPGAIILVDAAQAIGHMPIDAKAWDADFIAFSGHKIFAPTGIGILYGRKALLESLSPCRFGGGMVLDAVADMPEYKNAPERFEAGTPNIGGGIALAAAIRFVESIGFAAIRNHEQRLTAYALHELKSALGAAIRIIGPDSIDQRGNIISFEIDGIHPHDIAHLLGENGICVRAGEHCAAPLHRALGLTATTRLSFSIYNTEEDIDQLVRRLKEIRKILT
jgi:cysteine desulfurase / selenocysteine lyase